MIKIKALQVKYCAGGQELHVLSDLSLEIPNGQVLAIVGPSGSGKSTLLGMIAGLDKPSSGSIQIGEVDLENLDEDRLALFRRNNIGIIFQFFHLIPTLTAIENVTVPLEMNQHPDPWNRGHTLLKAVGLNDRLNHFPAQLSGGEQQRVAVARAFANSPNILLADEPTGNLDSSTGSLVVDLLIKLHRENGTTLVMATHDPLLAQHAERTITLQDGRIVSDQINHR